MSLLGFSRATLFDYLNPWSDLRIMLDEVLPRMLQAMKQETQVSAIAFLPARRRTDFPTRTANSQMLKLVAALSPKRLGHGRRMYSTPMCWPKSVQKRWSSQRLMIADSKSPGKESDVTNATSNQGNEVD